MTNLGQRVLMFFTFIPLILVLLFLFPEPRHLALQICCLIVGIGLAFETVQLYGFFTMDARLPLRRQTALRAFFIAMLALIPLGLRLLANFALVPDWWPLTALILLLFSIFGSIIPLTQKLDLHEVHERMRAYLMVLVFPVLGMGCFMTLMTFPHRTLMVSAFLAMIFGNDTVAYLAGRFLGKHSPHPMKISPNKTRVGFIAGFLCSPVFAMVFFAFAPELYGGSWILGILTGIAMGICTVVGDLFESALKRSSGIKDSGQLIPGRGGLLDSVDSLLFASPFFLMLMSLIHQQSFLGATGG